MNFLFKIIIFTRKLASYMDNQNKAIVKKINTTRLNVVLTIFNTETKWTWRDPGQPDQDGVQDELTCLGACRILLPHV